MVLSQKLIIGVRSKIVTQGLLNMAKDGLKVNIDVDNSTKVVEIMKRQLQTGLMACGMTAEGYAKLDSPVDTGRLRNSIAWAVKERSSTGDGRDSPNATPKEAEIYIGTNVEYAPEQELISMSHKVGKAHFLRDAMSTHADEYKEIIRAALDT